MLKCPKCNSENCTKLSEMPTRSWYYPAEIMFFCKFNCNDCDTKFETVEYYELKHERYNN